MIYAIEEWDFKDRQWRISCEFFRGRSAKRFARMRYKVLCARYPNNSYRIVEVVEKTVESRIGHRECEVYLWSKMNEAQKERQREREATCEKSSLVGNAAKMREALSDACYAMINFLKTQNGGYEEMAEALDKAKVAIAEPPRNCDIGTVLGQVSRHGRRCVIVDHCEVNCRVCFAKWAQMPYEEGGEKCGV